MDAVPFADRLVEAVERKRSQLVVGLDPLRRAADGAAWRGRAGPCRRGVGRRSLLQGNRRGGGPYVVAVKPQTAFFEALGSDGVRALEEVCDYARSTGLLVLLDAKRGDIGSTARAYAPPTSSLATAAPRSRTR